MGTKTKSTGTVSSRRKLVNFIVIGGFCGVIDLSLTLFFQYKLDFLPVSAKIIGFLVGTLVAFYCNSKWTFQSRMTLERIVQVLLLYGITFLFQEGIYTALSYIFPEQKTYSTIAFIIAQAVATFVNFVVQKLVIYGDSHSSESSSENDPMLEVP